MRNRLIYICSPCRGDMEKNIIKAQGYCREAVELWPDVIPIAPHVYFTQFFDETIPEERKIGMDAGIALLDICDEIWVYGIENPSEGMKREIEYANIHGIPVRDAAEVYRSRQQEEKPPIGELLVRFTEDGDDENTTGLATMHLSFDLLDLVTKRLRRNPGYNFVINGWDDKPEDPDEAEV
ncbi:MAG: hypothetical protein Q4C61_05300 [Lachnospiraceae bacterium]|nr:hypothetical protein [Lachnospiraceae bacterium]